MRINLKLCSETKTDVLLLLDRAVEGCGYTLPDEISKSYQIWVEGLEVAYAELRCSGFGPNDFDMLNAIIDYQRAEILGEEVDKSTVISLSAAVLKVFRDYMAYSIVMMPLGTGVYWKPTMKPLLNIIVTDEARPKGFIKLI